MTEEAKVGIQGLLAVINSLEAVVVCAGAVAKDGKVGMDDLQHLVELGKKYELFVELVKEAKNVPAQAKDLDSAELLVLFQELSELVFRLKDAFLKK